MIKRKFINPGAYSIFANQLQNDGFKQDEVAKHIAKKLGIPEELIRSPQEMAQMMQQMQLCMYKSV